MDHQTSHVVKACMTSLIPLINEMGIAPKCKGHWVRVVRNNGLHPSGHGLCGYIIFLGFHVHICGA